MIIKTDELLKLEEDLIKDTKELKSILYMNKDGSFGRININKNIGFEDNDIVYKLTVFVMIEKLQNNLLEGIDNKIRTSLVLLSSKKINLEKEKEQFNPKGFIDRLRKNLFNTNFTPEKLRLELNNVAICIDKLKSTTNKSFLIRTKNMSNTTHSHFDY